jgi:hypothetical protein
MSSITVITTLGQAQLAAAVANAILLESAVIVVGDGGGAIYVPNEAQTELVNEVWSGAATVSQSEDRVIFTAAIPIDVGGFTVREVGVKLGEIGDETLFIVSQHPVTQKIAAPGNGAGVLPIQITFIANSAQIAVLPVVSASNPTLALTQTPHITVDDLVTAPPGAPVDGKLYAIGTGATGAFTGKGGWLVERVAGAWVYDEPRSKSVIRLTTTGAWYQRDGAGWITLPFEDITIHWDDIDGKPATFPPSAHTHVKADITDFAHTHPQSQVDNLVADLAARVLKAGDVMTGPLFAPELRFGASSGASTQARLALDAALVIEAFAANNPAAKHDINMAPYGGRVGIGHIAPTELLDLNGAFCLRGNMVGHSTAHAFTIGPDPAANITAGGFLQLYGSTHPTNPGRVSFGSGGNELMGFVAGGAMALAGFTAPAVDALLAANGAGHAIWRTLAQLGIGRKVIAIGAGTSNIAVTFAATEPDTDYHGIAITSAWNGDGNDGHSAINGTLTSKTVSSCVVPPAAYGGGNHTTFYIIYRN